MLLRIGKASVTRIEEMLTPGFEPTFLFPDYDPAILERHPLLQSKGFRDRETGRVMSSMHSWLVRFDDKVILIDTGCGNGKTRPQPAFSRFHMLNTGYLDRLADAGVAPEEVTHVINTHLHVDHAGWNTSWRNGRWEPTFPNARYVFGAKEYDNWTGNGLSRRAQPEGWDTIVDSVLPVVEAGMVDFVEAGDRLGEEIIFHAAPGHTDGQLVVELQSDGQSALFTADVLHQPHQVFDPRLNSRFCEDNIRAPQTRLALLNKAADTNALVCPQHFGFPHCGYVRREGEAFAFEPLNT